ncbi:Cyanovirin-N [Madurella mycetomatis]|uniref:Cyanovirin-N n=1 Tax=Madurella mycetomatis TaxID=100816 RepID=A0A175VQH7_9PEZI|nr:Cyanovirin-N [Madurella mycetomatis]
MTFQSTSRGIYISGSILRAEFLDLDKNWRTASPNLDEFIGARDVKILTSYKNLSHSANNIQLCGSKLSASLRRHGGREVEATFNPNRCVANQNGSLKFQKPFRMLLLSARNEIEGPCIADDEVFYPSDIDFNWYYGNNNGHLVMGQYFYRSTRNVSIEPSVHSLLLKAELKGNRWWSGDFCNTSEIDMATCLLSSNGNLVFDEQ